MKKFPILYFHLLLFFWIIPCISHAQHKRSPAYIIDSLKNVLKVLKEDTNKVNMLNTLSIDLEKSGNYDSSLSYIEKAQALSEKIQFKKGLANAYRNMGIFYDDKSNYAKALEYQFKALTTSQDIGYKKGTAGALGDIGVIYSELGNYSRALEYYFEGLTISQQIGDQNSISTTLGNIGNIYCEQGNYPKALEYQLKSLAMDTEKGEKNGVAIDLSSIGGVYFAQGNYSKALEYLNKSLTVSQEIGNKYGVAIALDNIGNIYCEENNYPKALEYAFKALPIAQKIGNNNEVANLYSNIGEVYIKQKNYPLAKTFLDSSLCLSKNIGAREDTKITYSRLTVLDSDMGNYAMAFADYINYITYRDSIINQETFKKITQIEISFKLDSVRAEEEKADILKTSELNRKRIIDYGAVIILILIGIFLISRQQIKRNKDKIIFEKNLALSIKEKELLKLEKQQVDNELANSKTMLDEYIRNIVEKNDLLEQFKVDLEALKVLKSKEIDEDRIERLEYLNKITILTEDDWDKFKELFEQAHKGFFIRLKEKLPELTQAEIRLICLTRLQLDTKEMAGILGVSLDTIKKSRHRLRKKLGFEKDDSLNDFANRI